MQHQRRLDLDRRDPDATDLEHVVGAAGEVIVAVGVAHVLVAGLQPSADKGAAGGVAIVPVAGRERGPAAPEVAGFAVAGLVAVLVTQRKLVAGNRPSRTAVADRAGAVREKNVQRLGRDESVENLDAVALGPAPGDGFRQRLSGRAADSQSREALR